MRVLIYFLLSLLFLSSCEKFDWDNPYDPECPKDIFTPSSPGATMEGNSVKLTWLQQNDNISGFALFRNAEGEQIANLTQTQKSTTQYLDASITPGKKYTYYIVAVAGTNSSDTVKTEIVPVFPVTVSTGAITELAFTSAKLSGNITSAGGGTVTSRGICWSTSPSPKVSDNKTIEGTGLGLFSSILNNLLPGTTYFARAYGENSRGVSYGLEVSFTTLGPPKLTTIAVTNINATFASSGGTIISDGGSPISSKGIVWSRSSNPTIDLNTKSNEGLGSLSFTSKLVGLEANTTYFVRAYAINANGTAYGEQVSFTTSTLPVSLSTLSTNSGFSVTATTATSGGTITSDGGAQVIARGICWNKVGSPTIVNSRTQDGSGVGSFTSFITGLEPNTTYFIRAYATNAAGTAYGQEIAIKTLVSPAICTITGVTTGTRYNMQAPVAGSIFTSGDLYKITMANNTTLFGQAKRVSLYRNETEVYSFGGFLLFAESPMNARTFTIPSGMTPSTCYTIRVTKEEGWDTFGNGIEVVYITPKFEIR